jgi:hypothetical protein
MLRRATTYVVYHRSVYKYHKDGEGGVIKRTRLDDVVELAVAHLGQRIRIAEVVDGELLLSRYVALAVAIITVAHGAIPAIELLGFRQRFRGRFITPPSPAL